jgi:hypothetical protein
MPVPEEQRIYARWLDAASRTGFGVLVAAFLAYMFWIVDAHVPVEALPGLWTLPLEEYLSRTGTPTGWRWLGMLPKGEYLSLTGVVLLALATLLAYARLVVALMRDGDRLQTGIAAAQIAVLCVAALGFLAGGH